MLCCSAYYDLGCIGSCDCPNTGIEAPLTGDYTIEFSQGFSDTVRRVNLRNVQEGDKLFIPAQFNENTVVTFRIITPELIPLVYGGYECFRLQTYPQRDLPDRNYEDGCETPNPNYY